jgi:hypothetical protein
MKDSTDDRPLYAWKRLSDGKIVTPHLAHSKEELFENAGFGAVRVDEPIKGFLAVEVRRAGRRLVEVKTATNN